MIGSRISCLATLTVVAALVSSTAAWAQDDFDITPQNCVRAESIRSTRIINDRTVLFFLPGNRIYRNDLPDDCPRLAIERRFMYERRVGQRVGRLCDIDSITVINSSDSTPYGATCRLGMFYPIEQAEISEILSDSRALVQVEEIELPENDESTERSDGGADNDSAVE